MAELLLQKKHCAAIGKQIHMIKVKDGEEKLTCCGDEPFNPCEETYAKDSNGCGLHRVTLSGILFINIRCQSRLEGNNR